GAVHPEQPHQPAARLEGSGRAGRGAAEARGRAGDRWLRGWHGVAVPERGAVPVWDYRPTVLECDFGCSAVLTERECLAEGAVVPRVGTGGGSGDGRRCPARCVS